MDDSQLRCAVEAFANAIRIAGSQTAIAKVCDCTPGAISQLVLRKRPLSARFVLKVEAATGISRHDLRPDIYPVEHASTLVSPDSHPQGAKVPDGRNSSFPDAALDPAASQTVAGGEAARSSDDPGRAADTPEEIAPVEAAPPIGKAAA